MSNVEDYWVQLLDRSDGLVRKLDTSYGGSVTMNVNRTIRRGGKINVIDDGSINWLESRVKIWHTANGQDYSLGVYIPTAPMRENLSGKLGRYPVELHDKTKILDEDAVESTFSVAEGAVITEVVRDLILSAGEESLQITDSPEVAKSAMFWDAGTSKLRVVNDLLDYIGYFAIWTDADGAFSATPYARPQNRPLERIFERGRSAIHSADWSREQDLDAVPNKVVLVSQGDSEEEAMIGLATNENIESQFSFQRRGRWITHVEEGVEAASQEAIDVLAAKRLLDLSSPSATISLEHMVVPLQLNSVVRFVSGDIDTLAVVERMDFKLRPGSLCKATWREVVEI